MKQIYICLGGITISCSLQFDAAAGYFGKFITVPEEHAKTVSVPEEDWDFWRKNHAVIDPHLEFSSLTGVCSEVLLCHDRCAFHAVAVSHRGKAWLIAAGSGVGKTTQLRTLLKLYPEEFTVISGDRPILELQSDGTVFVHPSPWNGKEEMAGDKGVMLAGIICLKRGPENRIEKLSSRQAGLPVYMSVLHTGDNEPAILRAAAFTTELLKRVPAWQLTNREVPDSTKLLYETVIKEDPINEV